MHIERISRFHELLALIGNYNLLVSIKHFENAKVYPLRQRKSMYACMACKSK